MGNEESTMVDDSTRPSVLEARNTDAVAKYIKEHKVRRIVVMVRAPDKTTRGMLLTDTGWSGNQHLCWHPRFPVSRYGPLRQSGLPGPGRAGRCI